MLPYFRKLESDRDFDGPLHGKSGPIPIRRHRRERWNGYTRAVADMRRHVVITHGARRQRTRGSDQHYQPQQRDRHRDQPRSHA
ncbi:MAG TPA: hypothetical protein VIZ17_13995 [Acetobacteraceae bacterium]